MFFFQACRKHVISVVESPLKVFRASCVEFCHEVSAFFLLISAALRLLHSNFVDFNVMCASCLVFSGMS